jgi:hypothetical protein
MAPSVIEPYQCVMQQQKYKKTDRHDIAEKLMKVTLNTITIAITIVRVSALT